MIPAETEERRGAAKAGLLDRLHDPVQLHICVVAVVLLVGYGAIYVPLSEQIAAKTKKIKRDTKLLALAERYEQLQKQYHKFSDRLPEQSDTKEWIQYVLKGIRSLPVKLTKFDCRDSKQLGPYKVVVFQVNLEGTFSEIDQFLRWVETNRRLLRIDNLVISESQTGLGVKLTLLGLTG